MISLNRNTFKNIKNLSLDEIILEDIYWVHGGDDNLSGLNYCSVCVILEANKQNGTVDGGWGSESDHLEQCENCHSPLRSSIIDENNTFIETYADWMKYDKENE